MTVVDSGPSTQLLSVLWSSQLSESNSPGNRATYLPTLVTKSYHQSSRQLNVETQDNRLLNNNIPQNPDMILGSKSAYHNKYKCRPKPGLGKGISPSFAVDPEQHMRLVKEKQALYEQRTRPKTPIMLEPVNVLSLSRTTKSHKIKTKNQVRLR